MPAITESNSGLKYGYDLGENGWNTDHDANILKIGRIGFHLSILDRNLTDPSLLTPTDGDTYIPAAASIGDWSGLEGNVVVYDATAASWVNYTPQVGWVAYIEDEEVLCAYKIAGWSSGISI